MCKIYYTLFIIFSYIQVFTIRLCVGPYVDVFNSATIKTNKPSKDFRVKLTVFVSFIRCIINNTCK